MPCDRMRLFSNFLDDIGHAVERDSRNILKNDGIAVHMVCGCYCMYVL